MLDADLAELYEVEVGQLNRAVWRNLERFPKDFMFQLSSEEHEDLKCQNGISSSWGGRRHPPYVFTEQGVAILSSVLRSSRAVQVNIAIMRAFVKLRKILSSHRDLARRLNEMESRYDTQFKAVFDAIREMMRPPENHRPGSDFVRQTGAAPNLRCRSGTSTAGGSTPAAVVVGAPVDDGVDGGRCAHVAEAVQAVGGVEDDRTGPDFDPFAV